MFDGPQLRELIAEPALKRGPRPPLILLVALVASGTLGLHMIVPALPAAAADLGVSAGTIQLTLTLYLIGLALGQLLYGALSDRFGRRPVLLAGLALYALGGVLTVVAPNIATLIVARILQAVGGCSGFVLGRAMVRDGAEPDQAIQRLALVSLAMTASPALAPFIGGHLTAWFGWRSNFVALALLGLGILLWTVLVLPETNRQRAGGVGLAGQLASYLRLLRTPAFLGFALGGACTTTSFFAFLAAAPFIFQQVLHKPPEVMGNYFLLLMVGMALGSILANRLAGRVATRLVLRVANGAAILGAALFVLAHLTGSLSVATVVVPLAIFTLGIGTTSPFAVAGSVGVVPGAAGAASSLYGFCQMAHGALCTLIVSLSQGDPVLPAGLVMLGSAILGQAALTVALRRS